LVVFAYKKKKINKNKKHLVWWANNKNGREKKICAKQKRTKIALSKKDGRQQILKKTGRCKFGSRRSYFA
jgi:hypothetical protein